MKMSEYYVILTISLLVSIYGKLFMRNLMDVLPDVGTSHCFQLKQNLHLLIVIFGNL